MTGAEQVPIGEVARLDLEVVEVEGSAEYPVAGVYGFGRGLIDRGVIQGTDTRYARLQRLRANQIVLSRLKAFEGAVAVVPSEFDGHYVSQEFPTFTIDRSRADIGYVGHLCHWPDLWAQLGSGSKGIGARRERLHPHDFLAIKVPLPPLREQRQIAARLDSLLGAVEEIRSRATRFGRDAVLGTTPGVIESAIQEGSHSEVVLGDLVTVVSDTVRPGEAYGPAEVFVGLEHVESHTGRMIGSAPLGNERGDKRVFGPGDIVYGNLRPYLNKVWIADRHGLCSVDQRVLRPIDGRRPDDIAWAMRGERFLRQVIDATPGLTLPRIRMATALQLTLSLPSRADATVATIEQRVGQVLMLAQLRDRRQHIVEALSSAAINAAFAMDG